MAAGRDPTRVFTKLELLRDVWGYRDPIGTRTVDSHACRLRGKLTAVGVRMPSSVRPVGVVIVADLETSAVENRSVCQPGSVNMAAG